MDSEEVSDEANGNQNEEHNECQNEPVPPPLSPISIQVIPASINNDNATPARRIIPRMWNQELRMMMYGFGDVANPLPATVNLMEELLIDYMFSLVLKSLDIAAARKRDKPDVSDIKFVIRKDRRKMQRVRYLLDMKMEIDRLTNVKAMSSSFDAVAKDAAAAAATGNEAGGDDEFDEKTEAAGSSGTGKATTGAEDVEKPGGDGFTDDMDLDIPAEGGDKDAASAGPAGSAGPAAPRLPKPATKPSSGQKPPKPKTEAGGVIASGKKPAGLTKG